MSTGKVYITVDGVEYEFKPKTTVKNVIGFDYAAISAIEKGAKDAIEQVDKATKKVDDLAEFITAPVPKPVGHNLVIDYDGTLQSPIWENYNSKFMTMTGEGSSIDAGKKKVTFHLNNTAYKWDDGTTDDVVIDWEINKVTDNDFSVNTESMILDARHLVGYVNISCAANRDIIAVSSNTDACTVTVIGTQAIVTAVGTGKSTILITVPESKNHFANEATVDIEVRVITNLANSKPEDITEAAQGGYASTIFDIGDTVNIPLKGTIDGVSIDDTFKAVLIGFDHNKTLEGSNNIHFQIMRDSNNTNIAFASFKANKNDTNNGGYKTSNIREVARNIVNIIPDDWKNAIISVPKYSDNNGLANSSAELTNTLDKIFIPSLTELVGKNISSNVGEETYCRQYTYYSNGNSTVKYYHNDTENATEYWTRSVDKNSVNKFCYIDTEGNRATENGEANLYKAITPCFVIG